MDKSIYTAMSGARSTLQAQATVANNIANAQTTGFRAGHVVTEAFQVPGYGFATRMPTVQSTPGFDHSAGSIRVTGGDLDIALHGDNWLAVMGPDGEEAYTRAGELRLNENGMLMTASGHPVLGDNGPIAVPPNQRLSIGGDGTISIQPLGQGPDVLADVGRIRTVAAVPGQLDRGADGLMRAVDGEQLFQAPGQVMTVGALEGSNVDVAGSLVQMIELARQFELQVKSIKAAEENARSSTTLLRSS
ncbi:MAG: flagellar basal body rod protein FlgF [Lysobacteraceae bacterium]